MCSANSAGVSFNAGCTAARRSQMNEIRVGHFARKGQSTTMQSPSATNRRLVQCAAQAVLLSCSSQRRKPSEASDSIIRTRNAATGRRAPEQMQRAFPGGRSGRISGCPSAARSSTTVSERHTIKAGAGTRVQVQSWRGIRHYAEESFSQETDKCKQKIRLPVKHRQRALR
jgi:hypothetical protein